MALRSFQVEAGTALIHVREHTQNGVDQHPALVFLHYFGGSGRTWEPVMEILASRGWRCLAPDLRGFGNSPATGEAWAHYTVDTMADDVRGLVGRLELARFLIVGHSMGGKVALALAAQPPAGLAGVALLAPSPPTPEPLEDAERARLLAGHGNAAAVEETLGEITAHRLPVSLHDTTVADNLRASAPAWRAWLEHGSREDISARMPRIAVPVRIAVGGRDASITRSLVEGEIMRRLTHAETSLELVPDVGHLLPLEAPAATVGFLSAAFARF